MPTQGEIDLGVRLQALLVAAGFGGGGGGGGALPATPVLSGTVKTDVLELDPVVYVKASVDSNFYTKTAADARYSLAAHTHTFASLTSKPTTIGGYGITDFNALGDARWSLLAHTHALAAMTDVDLTGGPLHGELLQYVAGAGKWVRLNPYLEFALPATTLAGYGITDAYTKTAADARYAPLVHVHAGTDITTGTVAPARLGSGSGGATKFLREDSSFQALPGAAVAVKTAEVDFGARTFREGIFAIADATVAAAQKIIAWQSGEAATGRDADEAEFASFIVVPRAPVAGVGFTAYVRSLGDICELQGKFKINYLLG